MMYLYYTFLFSLMFQTCQIDPCQNKQDALAGYNKLIEDARQHSSSTESIEWKDLDKRKESLQSCIKKFEKDLTLEEQTELLGLNMQYNGLKLSKGMTGNFEELFKGLNIESDFSSDQIGNLMEGYISKFMDSEEFQNLDKEDIDIKINGYELDGDDIKKYMELLQQKSGDDIKTALESLSEALEEITKDIEKENHTKERKKL